MKHILESVGLSGLTVVCGPQSQEKSSVAYAIAEKNDNTIFVESFDEYSLPIMLDRAKDHPVVLLSNTLTIQAFLEELQPNLLDKFADVFKFALGIQAVPKTDGSFTVVEEVLANTSAVNDCIRNNKLYIIGGIQGINSESMDSSLRRAYLDGSISKETCLKYAYDKAQMTTFFSL